MRRPLTHGQPFLPIAFGVAQRRIELALHSCELEQNTVRILKIMEPIQTLSLIVSESCDGDAS
jgi:hypothetical protein